MALAILILFLPSQKTLAEIKYTPQNLQVINEFRCLSRLEQEKIVNCFADNLMLQNEIAKITKPPPLLSSWQIIAISTLGGVVGGLILAQQLHH